MELTFLTDQQIWGDDQGNGQLQVMKDYGTKTGMSDLAIVLGGHVSTPKTSDGHRTGFVWSASSFGYDIVRVVYDIDDPSSGYPYERRCGARPALPAAVASSIGLSEAKPSRNISGVDVVEYGEYPQMIAPENIGNELEQAFSKKQLKGTGKKYTFDAEKYDAYDKPFKAKEHAEYEHRGKRYIRVEAQPIDGDSVLSNGHTPAKGEAYWIEVQPIEWLRDPSGICVARQALFAGVQFDKNKSYDGDFAKTDMKQYLQNHFAKEMLPKQQVGQEASQEDTQTGHILAQRNRAKEALKPIIDAALDSLEIDLTEEQRKRALDAAAAAKREELRRRRS